VEENAIVITQLLYINTCVNICIYRYPSLEVQIVIIYIVTKLKHVTTSMAKLTHKTYKHSSSMYMHLFCILLYIAIVNLKINQRKNYYIACFVLMHGDH